MYEPLAIQEPAGLVSMLDSAGHSLSCKRMDSAHSAWAKEPSSCRKRDFKHGRSALFYEESKVYSLSKNCVHSS